MGEAGGRHGIFVNGKEIFALFFLEFNFKIIVDSKIK